MCFLLLYLTFFCRPFLSVILCSCVCTHLHKLYLCLYGSLISPMSLGAVSLIYIAFSMCICLSMLSFISSVCRYVCLCIYLLGCVFISWRLISLICAILSSEIKLQHQHHSAFPRETLNFLHVCLKSRKTRN